MVDFIALLILIGGLLLLFWILGKEKKKINYLTKKGLFVADKEKIKEKWQEIEKLLELQGESRFKTAVIEADKLLMAILESMGFSSGTAKEKLLSAKSLFSDFDAVFKAHLLRNRIVHEVDFILPYYEAKEAIKQFQKALKDLGVL